MIDEAKWRANKPNEVARVFEAEWDGRGAFPSDNSLIRNADECPEKLKDKIRHHYKKLQAFLTGKTIDGYFIDGEKYSDVWAHLTTLPENITFPSECRYLDLSSVTTLPENITFPSKCDTLDLRSVTTLPENITFPSECRYLDLSSVTTLPEN
ncbi:MAG: hypothetical protein KGL39_27070, partial [Patescibacteria group bacterium]|nr:hypothetical protein [Patescibacteria group bacterium]